MTEFPRFDRFEIPPLDRKRERIPAPVVSARPGQEPTAPTSTSALYRTRPSLSLLEVEPTSPRLLPNHRRPTTPFAAPVTSAIHTFHTTVRRNLPSPPRWPKSPVPRHLRHVASRVAEIVRGQVADGDTAAHGSDTESDTSTADTMDSGDESVRGLRATVSEEAWFVAQRLRMAGPFPLEDSPVN